MIKINHGIHTTYVSHESKIYANGQNARRKQLSFGIFIVWWEHKNHVADCYFCLTKTSWCSKKTWQELRYPNLDSAIRLTHMKYQYLLSQNCLHCKMRMIYVNQMIIMGMSVIQALRIYKPKNVKTSTRQNSMV